MKAGKTMKSQLLNHQVISRKDFCQDPGYWYKLEEGRPNCCLRLNLTPRVDFREFSGNTLLDKEYIDSERVEGKRYNLFFFFLCCMIASPFP